MSNTGNITLDEAEDPTWEVVQLPVFFSFPELITILQNNATLQRQQIIKMLQDGASGDHVLAATQQLFRLDDFRTIILNNSSNSAYDYSVDVNLKRKLKVSS
jgi:hypothetical protein